MFSSLIGSLISSFLPLLFQLIISAIFGGGDSSL